MKVLTMSSSRVGNGGFLEHAVPLIINFIGSEPHNIAFVPFASVQRSYEEYGKMVQDALSTLPYIINTVDLHNAKEVIENTDAIMVGGGNTFKLLHDIYKYDLFELIQNKVKNGTPYIGWSAGGNLTGRTICTTNDMPIIQPQSFQSFAFFPFQINPHYLNQTMEGHNGETRDQRLEEFIVLNPDIPVVGLPEGTALQLNDSQVNLIGDREVALFKGNAHPQKKWLTKDEDLSFLLQ